MKVRAVLFLLVLQFFSLCCFAAQNKESAERITRADIMLYILHKKAKASGGIPGVKAVSEASEVAEAVYLASTVLAERLKGVLDRDFVISLVVGIVEQESGFKANARSCKDALGLMQVHWATWNRYISSLGLRKEHLYNPYINTLIGVSILYHYLDISGYDPIKALYRYYGTSSVKYAKGVLKNAKRFYWFAKKGGGASDG